MDSKELLWFGSDYQEGCHEALLAALTETNLLHTPGYGTDEICERARQKIRDAIGCPDAAVYFAVGGTQTNALMISTLLADYEGVIAPHTGHICGHEAGAIEYGGHKVLFIEGKDGKLSAEGVESFMKASLADENRDHGVLPGMVYISQPTEFGTLYSKAELVAIHDVCRKYGLKLYFDGARLAYALGTPENDVALSDYPALFDAFYIGGTKCGALFGEAIVLPDPTRFPHFFTIMKQRGAVLAKGRLHGVQFDALFTDGLYESIGKHAVALADRIREGFTKKGYRLLYGSPTNQLFVLLTDEDYRRLSSSVVMSHWGKPDETHTIVRLVTSWATTEEDVEKLLQRF